MASFFAFLWWRYLDFSSYVYLCVSVAVGFFMFNPDLTQGKLQGYGGAIFTFLLINFSFCYDRFCLCDLSCIS